MAYLGTNSPKPDDTEGYASITLTLKEPSSEIKTIACFIKNDETLQELQFLNQTEKYVKTHEDQNTKFFLYFHCSESDLSTRLVKSEIVAHRFTKPNKDKNCIIENKLETQPFFLRDNHVFLPACHKDLKTVDFEKFLSAHSSAVTKKNLSAGKYRGVQNSDVPDRVKYYPFLLSSSTRNNTLNIPNLAYKVFQNLVDGPLLLLEEASWRLIGWYEKALEGDRITVYHLGTHDTTDIWKTSISNQTDGILANQPHPGRSGYADSTSSTDHSDHSFNHVQDPVSHNQPTQNSMAYQLPSGSNVGLSSDGANGQQDGVSTVQPRVEPGHEMIVNTLGQMGLEDRNSPSLQQEVPPPQANGIQSERPQTGLQNRVINEEQRSEDGAESETGQLEQQVHAQEEAAPALSEDPSVADLMEKDEKLLDKICSMLYQYRLIIKNWEGLATQLDAPPSIRARLKRPTQHSQTRALFDTMSSLSKTEKLTVQELITVFKDLRRQDVVDLLEKKIPENERQGKVTEKVMSDEALMEELETLLDKESKVVKNWYHIGLRLGLPKETLQEIKDGDYQKTIGRLFAYIYSKHPKLTVEQFKQIMVKIDRKDVLNKLSDVSEGLMKASIPLYTGKMYSIWYLLSKNTAGVKDWKHLARELNFDDAQCKNFEKETPESPTKLLLEWALIEEPDMTVSDLCVKLRNIDRNDVIGEIEEFYGHSFIQS